MSTPTQTLSMSPSTVSIALARLAAPPAGLGAWLWCWRWAQARRRCARIAVTRSRAMRRCLRRPMRASRRAKTRRRSEQGSEQGSGLAAAGTADAAGKPAAPAPGAAAAPAGKPVRRRRRPPSRVPRRLLRLAKPAPGDGHPGWQACSGGDRAGQARECGGGHGYAQRTGFLSRGSRPRVSTYARCRPVQPGQLSQRLARIFRRVSDRSADRSAEQHGALRGAHGASARCAGSLQALHRGSAQRSGCRVHQPRDRPPRGRAWASSVLGPGAGSDGSSGVKPPPRIPTYSIFAGRPRWPRGSPAASRWAWSALATAIQGNLCHHRLPGRRCRRPERQSFAGYGLLGAAGVGAAVTGILLFIELRGNKEAGLRQFSTLRIGAPLASFALPGRF